MINEYSCICNDWLVENIWLETDEAQNFDYCPYCGKRLERHKLSVNKKE